MNVNYVVLEAFFFPSLVRRLGRQRAATWEFSASRSMFFMRAWHSGLSACQWQPFWLIWIDGWKFDWISLLNAKPNSERFCTGEEAKFHFWSKHDKCFAIRRVFFSPVLRLVLQLDNDCYRIYYRIKIRTRNFVQCALCVTTTHRQ